ncbi:MAG: sugar phosphate nucleotidyltransferase, partial [Gammaproteobacteria bacterium]
MLIANRHAALVLVLAIGDGKPLLPLTARRAAAALPYAGTYRVIDFALTNCMHSGLRRINVLTQYNALSLQNHLRDGWSIFNIDLGEFVTAVSPPINDHLSTYTGQANALFNNLYILDGAAEDVVLIASGEQIYRMDYAAMVEYHLQRGADVTIAAIDRETALGGSFPAFFTAVDTELKEIIDRTPATPLPDGDGAFGPMGVYVFQRKALVDILIRLGEEGTRAQSIVDLIRNEYLGRMRIFSYRFGGEYGRVTQDRYWRTLDNLD